jgi:ubiquinone/menaquinone biosynthesis C-methylase UbiE
VRPSIGSTRKGGSGGSPRRFALGTSTAAGGQATHRIQKLAGLQIVHGRWLDAGCASGHYTVALRAAGAESVIGIDIADERVREANKRWSDVAAVEFLWADIENAPFPDASFDGILLNEVLEHVTDQEKALREMARVLVSGGFLAVFSPNRWFPFEGHRLVIGSRELQPPLPLVPWLPRSVTQPFMVARNYWPRELKRLVEEAGFTTLHLGFAYPLFGTYRALPRVLIPGWRAAVATLETLPFIRHFGVSTLVVGQKRVDDVLPRATGDGHRYSPVKYALLESRRRNETVCSQAAERFALA